MSEKRYYVNCVGYLCDMDLSNTLSIFECADLLNQLTKENEWLKQQLLYDGDDVCGICKHEYLTPSGNYFIAKCEKGHEECSKENIKYCEDFKLKELEDE